MSQYKKLKNSSGLSGGNATFVEDLYESWLESPENVSTDWQKYFKNEFKTESSFNDQPRLNVQDKFAILATLPKSQLGSSNGGSSKQNAVNTLINAYRSSGHKIARTDPLNFRDTPIVSDLELSFHGLSNSDMNEVFETDSSFPSQQMTLKEIITVLEKTYTSSIGVEYSHIHNIEEKRWLQERLEKNTFKPTVEHKKKILDNLIKAEGLEKYLATRYVGQKRFSLEGGDSLIPLMHDLVHHLGDKGVKETVIGMAHRGRLNLLINIMGKSSGVLFDEFEGRLANDDSPGDVKYHLGFSSDIETKSGSMHMTLAFNPSHLEIVNPVVQGSVRARMERLGMQNKVENLMDIANSCVPIQIHGDAAFAGQGVNMETLQLSQVRDYKVGGTVHIIINNQVGFTTSNPLDSRSSLYASDPVKMIEVPVFHVNADDPEAVAFVTQLAADFLVTFQKDVMIDLVCYRRLGHNEADDPSMTQPRMYEIIKKHKTTATLYSEKLISENIINSDEVKALKKDYNKRIDNGEVVASSVSTLSDTPSAQEWKKLTNINWQAKVDTTVTLTEIESLSSRIFRIPEGFSAHRLVSKTLQTRIDMSKGEKLMDWGFAENLAYATLLNEDFPVRLSGEDVGRGTFTHRQAVLHDAKTGESYLTLTNVKEDQPTVRVIDSVLSEEAVLAFEYGYSASSPNSLVVWEAQFGDFANGAQVVFDQFIASGEAKWGRYSGLVVYLPHGQEGMGPEHSSARLERWLQLCADNNMRVCVPSTPAQCFHMIRRQVKQNFRKPLIVMTPKSLLRHKLAVSTRDDLTSNGFQPVINEIDSLNKSHVERIVFCAGKVYYDLLEERRKRELNNIAILRIEELYPFPAKNYADYISEYENVKSIIWCQEEPKNQGAWRNIAHNLQKHNPNNIVIDYTGRKSSASTAAGYASVFKKEQAELINQALTI